LGVSASTNLRVSGRHIRDAPLLDEHEQLAVIHGLRKGSRDAWARLYDACSVDVWRYAARLLGPDAAAVSDIVQEAFIEAARSARNFDPSRGTVWNWLAGIVHHRVSAYWRESTRQDRLRQLANSGELDVGHLLDGQQETKAALESRDIADFVRRVLAELPFDYASLLTAKYLDDCSLAAIAVDYGSSIEAAKSRLARARQQFRSKFEHLSKMSEVPVNRIAAEKRQTTEKQS
jgi:RNA polymerase sigma-70 factor (ECF subfamily)